MDVFRKIGSAFGIEPAYKGPPPEHVPFEGMKEPAFRSHPDDPLIRSLETGNVIGALGEDLRTVVTGGTALALLHDKAKAGKHRMQTEAKAAQERERSTFDRTPRAQVPQVATPSSARKIPVDLADGKVGYRNDETDPRVYSDTGRLMGIMSEDGNEMEMPGSATFLKLDQQTQAGQHPMQLAADNKMASMRGGIADRIQGFMRNIGENRLARDVFSTDLLPSTRESRLNNAKKAAEKMNAEYKALAKQSGVGAQFRHFFESAFGWRPGDQLLKAAKALAVQHNIKLSP